MIDKIGSLIIDLESMTVSAEERELLNHPLVGGVILFAKNYESREQLTQLSTQIKSTRCNPLILMVDQEGGRVQRFIHEFTRLPYMAEFGKIYDKDPDAACHLAQECGWLMATELLAAGIDLSLAPVLDLNKGISSIIGQRAFHSNPQHVIQIASAFIRGMREAGMASTGKHFPGHGSVQLDSHIANPIDERSIQEIEREDMVAFAGMVNAGISAIMAAHIVFPKGDTLPVGYSHYWLKDVLRDGLGFNGVIFSDDLSMEGANISSHFSDRVLAAREAGCDFALLCNNRAGVIQVLDDSRFASHWVNREKWGVLQGNFAHVRKQAYQENPRWREMHHLLEKMNTGEPFHEHPIA